jgi:AraC family transcriptional regulator
MDAKWDTYADFYTQGPYAPYSREHRVGGSTPVHLLDIAQPPGDWSDPEVPDLVFIQTLTEGIRAQCDLGGGRFTMRPPKGAINIVAPNTPTQIIVDDFHELRVCAISAKHVTALFADARPVGDLFDFGRLHTSFLRSDFASEVLLRMWNSAAADLPTSRLAIDGAVLTLLSEVFAAADRPKATARGGLAPWQLRWVREHMEAHIGEDVGLSTLAALVQLSPNHFCSAFKTSTGEPPHRALIRMRVERAMEMLADGGIPITEIGLGLGFGSSAHFSTVFRKQTGLSPSDWRREYAVAPYRRIS